ncbi:hypothetical protein [Candidatus Symbiopectobacterium sp.]|uniref:hypothetical protein n=1 Tax=Candidatus Symbiopectobacterium sp. TaxID=2816440 RepID=UPI0025BCF8BA|nr:hypothetical protein [Candidatus Symbiopectobacterium sp.]
MEKQHDYLLFNKAIERKYYVLCYINSLNTRPSGSIVAIEPLCHRKAIGLMN